MKILKEYINENLVKGFIRVLVLPVKSLMLFVLKKNRTKRLYINYWKINEITVKNRYLLLLANKLRDKLQRVKIFIKLDLRGVYNLIRIKEGEE